MPCKTKKYRLKIVSVPHPGGSNFQKLRPLDGFFNLVIFMIYFTTQLNSTQLNSTQLNSTQLNSTQLNSITYKRVIVILTNISDAGGYLS